MFLAASLQLYIYIKFKLHLLSAVSMPNWNCWLDKKMRKRLNPGRLRVVLVGRGTRWKSCFCCHLPAVWRGSGLRPSQAEHWVSFRLLGTQKGSFHLYSPEDCLCPQIHHLQVLFIATHHILNENTPLRELLLIWSITVWTLNGMFMFLRIFHWCLILYTGCLLHTEYSWKPLFRYLESTWERFRLTD